MVLSPKISKVTLYLIGIIIMLYITKPAILFKPNGRIREYGFNHGKDGSKRTLFTMHTIVVVSVVLLYVYL